MPGEIICANSFRFLASNSFLRSSSGNFFNFCGKPCLLFKILILEFRIYFAVGNAFQTAFELCASFVVHPTERHKMFFDPAAKPADVISRNPRKNGIGCG